MLARGLWYTLFFTYLLLLLFMLWPMDKETLEDLTSLSLNLNQFVLHM